MRIRRFERRARFGMALLSVVPTYSRGSGGILVIYSMCKLSCGERDCHCEWNRRRGAT